MESADLHRILETYPDIVASDLELWKKAEAETKRLEAMAYFRFKAEAETAGEKITEKCLEKKVDLDEEIHKARMEEIVLEATYQRNYEMLMSCKRIAQLRTAY